MVDKGIYTVTAIFAEYLSVSLPLALAGIIDTITLPFRLFLGLFIGP